MEEKVIFAPKTVKIKGGAILRCWSVWDQYAPCVNDDELNLFLSKKLF